MPGWALFVLGGLVGFGIKMGMWPFGQRMELEHSCSSRKMLLKLGLGLFLHLLKTQSSQLTIKLAAWFSGQQMSEHLQLRNWPQPLMGFR